MDKNHTTEELGIFNTEKEARDFLENQLKGVRYIKLDNHYTVLEEHEFNKQENSNG